MQCNHDGCDNHWDLYVHCYSFWPTHLGFLKLGSVGSATIHLPECFCPWTFSLNIGLNVLPLDTFIRFRKSKCIAQGYHETWIEVCNGNNFFTQLTLHFESSTLIVDHKNHFFDNEWKLICLFIWTSFCREHDCNSMKYNGLLVLKWKYKEKIRDVKNLGINMNTFAKVLLQKIPRDRH